MTKRIQVYRISIRNFKGIRDFAMDISGQSVRIYGDNAVGKTTLFDAFMWVLFDKDSQNKKDFQIKTLDKEGNVIHGLEHEVEVILAVDGKAITLRKVYAEKWTKKRGSATAEFTGHTTDYYIDGVPVKKSEYTSRVDQIVSEDIFKLLTSPTYFNEQLHWGKRREILLQVCGDVSNEDVIASNKDLAKLPDILGERSIEDHRKVIAARRAEINKELDKLPVRIDEVQRTLPDITGISETFIQQQLDILSSRIEGKEAELSRVQSGGEIVVKEKRLREIEGELLQIKNQLQEDTLDQVSKKRLALMTIKTEYSKIQQEISEKKWALDRNQKFMTDKIQEAEQLRQKWFEVNGLTFESHHDLNCPTCGQSLPEEQVQSAHEKALANFNRNKSKQLEEITTKGKASSAEVKRCEEENDGFMQEVEELNLQLTQKEKALQLIESELNILQAGIIDVEMTPQYITKKQEASSVQQEIEELRSSTNETATKIREEISQMRTQSNLLEQDKAKLAQAQAGYQRIEQLKQQEKELAAEFERLEHELFLTEEFIRTKVNLLESKINGKFKFARFKLFEQQINGGLTEVCETLYDGVPYSSGLNNAAMINVGLDIINTLSEHYGFSAPIFIDNAEAVTRLIETNSQVIALNVSETDKQLRMEMMYQNVQEAV